MLGRRTGQWVWWEAHAEFLEAESDGHSFWGLQLLEILLPNAHLSHHGFDGAVCWAGTRKNLSPGALGPTPAPHQGMSGSLTRLLLLVASKKDPVATANTQCHFSQCWGKRQNGLPQDPVWATA